MELFYNMDDEINKLTANSNSEAFEQCQLWHFYRHQIVGTSYAVGDPRAI